MVAVLLGALWKILYQFGRKIMLNIIKRIQGLAEKGIIIDYMVIDQKENGHWECDPTIPLKTYTVYVRKVSSFGDPIEAENFDSLEKGLEKMIKFAERLD